MKREYPADEEFELKDFDQNEFYFNSANAFGMDNSGFVFVPEDCKNGTIQCNLHVHFHGCKQVGHKKPFTLPSQKYVSGKRECGSWICHKN